MSSSFILTLALAIVCAYICAVSASSDGILEKNGVCGANAERVWCGRKCERTCRLPAERMCTLNPKYCTDDCVCKDGFVLNEKTGECVRFGDCPQNVPHH